VRAQPEGGARSSRRRRIGLAAGPVLALAVLAYPFGMPPPAHRLAAIFALVIVYWVTEAIPLAATAILGPALAVVAGVAGAREAFAAFGNPIIFLFLGSFLIARGMTLHGLDRRIALFVLSRPWVGERPGRILLAFGLIGAFLSMWISNTATAAMMLPIGLGVLKALPMGGEESAPGRRYATGLMLMIAYACEIGGIATPVGTPPNLIAIGMIQKVTGREIGFLEWMSIGLPVTIVCFAVAYLVISRLYGAGRKRIEGAMKTIRAERAKLGPWRRGELSAFVVFLAVVALWIVPGTASLVLGDASPVASALNSALPESAAAVLAALLLFVLPGDRDKPGAAMSWQEGVQIDWGTILLFGGGLALGGLAFGTGLASTLGSALGGLAATLPAVMTLLAVLLIACLITEFMSNTAAANLLVPLFLALGAGVAGGAMPLAIAATIGCSLAFCLPVATPPNAIVYGSGRVTLGQMLKAGILIEISCALATWGVLLARGIR